jgi:hypothetical protein
MSTTPNRLAAIFVLRGVDANATQHLFRHLSANYRGPDFGGVDLMAANANGEAWMLLGRWTDALDPTVQAAATEVLRLLGQGAELLNAGVAFGEQLGAVNITSPSPYRVEIVPWIVTYAVFARGIDDARWQRWLADLFPRTEAWIGMHMGAPHWLGTGVEQTQGRIHRVTPYARLDRRPDGSVIVTAVADEARLAEWGRLLSAALGL